MIHLRQFQWSDYSVPEADRLSPADMMTEDEYFDERRTSGSLVIAEFGCGAFYRLVITGPARGQVWFDDRAADGGLTPEAEFRAWYLDWLRPSSVESKHGVDLK